MVFTFCQNTKQIPGNNSPNLGRNSTWSIYFSYQCESKCKYLYSSLNGYVLRCFSTRPQRFIKEMLRIVSSISSLHRKPFKNFISSFFTEDYSRNAKKFHGCRRSGFLCPISFARSSFSFWEFNNVPKFRPDSQLATCNHNHWQFPL